MNCKSKDLADQQRKLLIRIIECGYSAGDAIFESDEREILEQLQKDGMVSIIWCITLKGLQVATRPECAE